MTAFHIAQINVARALAPLDDPAMTGLVALLDEINALADRSPGFVWRFQTEEGNSAYVRAYEDDQILVTFSVWESVEHLRNYVYKSAHGEVLKRKHEWFSKFDGMYLALWWVREGRIPSIDEAKCRLEHLRRHGESPTAFTFKHVYDPVGMETEISNPESPEPKQVSAFFKGMT